MATMRLKDVARRTAGRILQGSPDLHLESYGIDSRRTGPGELFFAVVGARDGHEFVADAARRGAAAAVVSRPLPSPVPAFGIVQVGDTVQALQDLARSVLEERRPKVVGITGSVGKTTTKEFAAELLAARHKVLKSEGNYNNHLGLALSLLRIGEEDEVAVLEMGMSAPGEILRLTRVAPPDVAVITNIGPVHLEFFGSLRDVALAKKEILDGAREGAVAVLNGDDPLVLETAEDWKGPRVTFGLSPDCDIRADDVGRSGFAGLSFRLHYGQDAAQVDIPLVNEAVIPNLLAASGAAWAFGLSLEEILPRMAFLRPLAMRGVLAEIPGGVRLFDDSYNSNPRALEATLKSLGALPAGRKIAVLADMLELGEGGPEFHRRAGQAVAAEGWDVLVAVGPLAALIADGAREAGLGPERIHRFPDSEAAAAGISEIVRSGDLVLVKGSRGMKMEKIVERLKAGGKE